MKDRIRRANRRGASIIIVLCLLSLVPKGAAFVPSKTTGSTRATTVLQQQVSRSTTPAASHIPATSNQSVRQKNKNLTRSQIAYYKLHQELKKLKRTPFNRNNNRRGGAQLAEQRLLEALKDDELRDIVTEVTFNIVIMGYAHQARFDSTTAPTRAEGLLQKMISHGITPTPFSYNAVCQAWSNARVGVRGYKAILRLLDEMKEQYGYEPSTFTYNLLIASNLAKAQEWYDVMLQKQQATEGSGDDVYPDRQTYHLLFKSYGKSGEVEKAEALVEELTERATTEEDLRPHNVWINCVISALGKSKPTVPDAGARADAWLKRMQHLYQLGQTNMRPDAATFSQVMNVHAVLGNTKRVMELLQELEHRFVATGERQLQPDTVSYTTAMKAHAKNPPEASKLLQIMHDLHAAGRHNVAPNIVTYNTVIRAWAGLATREGLMKAQELLEKEVPLPNAATYVSLIFGWSASGLGDAGYRAQGLLQELEALPPSKQKGVELTKLYNAVILAWGRSSGGGGGRRRNGKEEEAPRRAEELLTKLEIKYANGNWKACPNIVTFVSVADAYAKASIPDAEERCELLLLRMETLHQTGIQELRPNRVLYNTILNALAKSCQSSAVDKAEEILTLMQASEDESLRPDIVTYATIIDCYTKCSSGDSSDRRADEILATVEEAYQQDRSKSLLQPNAVFYSAVLQAYAKTATPEGAAKAEALLRRNQRLYQIDPATNEHCKPHAILFNAVIDAVARSGLPNAGQHAEALLQEMEDFYQAGDDSYRVTRRSLNAVLLAYRNDVHEGGTKAEYILRRMEELTEAGVYDVMPDVIAWNTAIGAIAHSEDPTAAERAQAMLDRMEDLYSVKTNQSESRNNFIVQPDGITYSYVIEAWLKRNDEKGNVMAHKLLDKFFSLKDENSAATDRVWDVIKAYQCDMDRVNSAAATARDEKRVEFPKLRLDDYNDDDGEESLS